ncbi:14734_t:CDS:2, partial [Funneliformis geosporum]
MNICSRFGVSEGSIIFYVNRVMKATRNKKSEFVQWPKDNNRSVIHTGFQNVIGAIDETHFIITETPTQDPTAYFTRKKIFYSNSDFYLNRTEYIQDEDYVLSDSAYPISFFLISPFKNPSNNRLKARFRVLKEISVKDLKTAINLAD